MWERIGEGVAICVHAGVLQCEGIGGSGDANVVIINSKKGGVTEEQAEVCLIWSMGPFNWGRIHNI